MSRPVIIQRWRNRRLDAPKPDEVAVEEPLEIRVEGRSISVVMRTPGHDRELAAGFLLTEGVIKSAKDLFDVTTCVTAGTSGAAVDAALVRPDSAELDKLTRHVFTSSSCGVCSKATIDAVLKRRRALEDDTRVTAAVLLSLPAKLATAQRDFAVTGGLHACALFSPSGELLAAREDVGRHNALDKLIGWALLEKRTPLHGHIVFLSGRVSFEMMQKAHAAGLPIVAAISAPTSLAVEFARDSGQTLAGFVRGESLNIYTGAERIVAPRRTRVKPAA